MSITHEQIQALRAAAESCGKQEPLSLVVYHGKMCLRNKGGIVFTVLRDICFPEYSAENENYARLAELCTSDSILSLLAEREADKALIAEQDKRLIEYAGIATDNANRVAELEAHTLTVKFPEDWHFEECETEGCQNGALFSVGKAAKNLHLCEACAKEPANSRLSKTALPKRLPFRIAAGITLVVGE